jgi:dihydrofolate synthase/folylpolyglutamate synthase
MEHHDPLSATVPITSSADVFTWLSRFINRETGQFTTSLRLDRMAALAQLAGHPEKSAPVIHIAGSKGKGSVTGMITAMLQAHGLRPARYTSPHVTEYRERITLGNDFFDESIYSEAGEELISVEAALRNIPNSGAVRFDTPAPDDTEATFFELLTLYFFLCARRAGCDVMVVETGLGGRLDATNIVDPVTSVITLIELEHTEFLGNTVADIAEEKAGIIKTGKPVVLGAQAGEALEVFKIIAGSRNAPLYYLPDQAALNSIRITPQETAFTLTPKNTGMFSGPLALTLPIAGEIQAQNAGLAVLAAKTAFPQLTDRAIQDGLRGFTLPARFERIMNSPVLIVDGAHTAHSVEACVGTFTSLYGNQGVLLFGCAAGKDIRSMSRILIPNFSYIIITTPGTFKISFPEEIYTVFTHEAPEYGRDSRILYIPETSRAIEHALGLARDNGMPLLGTGSFYLAAEIRNSVIQRRGHAGFN